MSIYICFAPYSADEYFVLQDKPTALAGNYPHALLSATKGEADCGIIRKTAPGGQLSEKRSFETVADKNGEDE